ncbi:MAG: LytTR family DNA-binding domain-containing protein [Treponema sp.]|nr:LytTR family DNA-binding domain-containing protein [Treponema sp.]
MNILICDDIRDEALKLENAVKKAGFGDSLVIFEKAQDALECIKNSEADNPSSAKIDVCFLDIIMPEMDGIELAGKMRAAGFSGKIIYLSTSRDYGVESYQVKAYNYLLKPVNVKDVAQLLNEIKNSAPNEDTAGIKIETRNMTRFVHFYEISFVEVINKNVYFRLLDGSEVVIFASLSEVLPQLTADGRFAQCHRSYVVNMDAIAQIQGKEILFQCGRKAPVSRKYNNFNSQYFTRIFAEDKNG